MKNIVHMCDCMEFMRGLPDKAYDLAIVDPPYGGGVQMLKKTGEIGKEVDSAGGLTSITLKANNRNSRGRFQRYSKKSLASRTGGVFSGEEIEAVRTDGTWAAKYGKEISHWDIAPDKDYFTELFRISKNQIVWGGNYFALPPTRCFIVWEKLSISESFSMAMAEYAWCSFNENAKIWKGAPQGTAMEPRIHPTQKPVALYKWLLERFAKPGWSIFDSHVGSGSSRIACHDMGFDFEGCEIDPVYWELQEKRFAEHCQQGTLFEAEEIQRGIYQGDLFAR